jgi:hypothetical protein
MIMGIASWLSVKIRTEIDRDLHLPPVGSDEGPDAAEDLRIEDPAEHLLLHPVGAHDRARRAAAVLAHVVAFDFRLAAHRRSP